MARKHIAFLIVYGPEVRAFVHSGLIKKLSEKYDVSIITTHPGSSVFDGVDYATIHQMPKVSENRLLLRLRNWSRRSQQAWLEKRKMSTWVHLIPSKAKRPLPLYKRLWRSFFQQANWYYFWPPIERLTARLLGTHPTWRKLYLGLDLDCLVSASLKGETVLPGLQTARNMRSKIVTATHSWKDIYVSSYLSVVPERIAMPNRQAIDFLLAVNPHVSRDKLLITTSLHFEKILNPDQALNRQEFCGIAGLDWQRPYICYTAATPLAVSGELEIIRELVLMLYNNPKQPQLLLRVNPMDEGSQFSALQKEFPSLLVIQKPLWEWNYQGDWCCPMETDVSLWFNTIFHATCNISIPSTVTMEFAALKKPVINICFDLVEEVVEESSISRFWNAPFYEEIRQSNYVIPTFSIEELCTAVQHVLGKSPETPEVSFFPTRYPVQQMIRQIEGVLDN